jgi:hypothetical protein
LQEALRLRVKADQIRECSANVDCDDDLVGALPFSRLNQRFDA